jgi:hypothetical protein
MLENFFLNLNFSWFSSRFSAYMVIQLISIMIFYIIRKKNHFKRKFFKLALYSLILLTPTLTYFYFYPIFKGDVLNLGERPRTKILFSEKKKIVVFVLPDCSYCHESLTVLRDLLKRNPNLQIEIWITGENKDSFYNSIDSDRVKIVRNDKFDQTIYLTQGVFPTYALTNKKKLIKRWTNESFGARALDEMEQFFKVYN